MSYAITYEEANVALTVNRKRFGVKIFFWPRQQQKLNVQKFLTVNYKLL